jgi:hypothetical protein
MSVVLRKVRIGFLLSSVLLSSASATDEFTVIDETSLPESGRFDSLYVGGELNSNTADMREDLAALINFGYEIGKLTKPGLGWAYSQAHRLRGGLLSEQSLHNAVVFTAIGLRTQMRF